MEVSYYADFAKLLRPTPMLDYEAANVQALVAQRGWRNLPTPEAAVRPVHEFCRDEILFGYNAHADDMPASAVLQEGVGHCNTKATLLMALLRAVGVPCRLQAFRLHKQLQRGAMPLVYRMAPHEIVHISVQRYLNDRWITLEGPLLDTAYLHAVQERFGSSTHPTLVITDLQSPRPDCNGPGTFTQRGDIARNLGIHSCPDDFYAAHGTSLRGFKAWLYRTWWQPHLNRNIERVRRQAHITGLAAPS